MPFRMDAADLAGLESKLRTLGWLGTGEMVRAATKAGEGNMNYTLRVDTGERTFIVKQARPWVEKYPQIPAPEERVIIEADFYRLISEDAILRAGMPKLIGSSEEDHLLALEDAGADARDFTYLYKGGGLERKHRKVLVEWLDRLHRCYRGREFDRNANMRALNHEYIFVQPLTTGYVFPDDYKEAVEKLGNLYLADGSSLLHGDYFPGSWLDTPAGVRVIDPEFAFLGPPEFDAGVFLAHLHLAGDPNAQDVLSELSWCEPRLTRQFAGVEIMRRILGVAQLPLRADESEKRALLDLSKEFILQ